MRFRLTISTIILLLPILSGCSGNSEQAKCENTQRLVDTLRSEADSLKQTALTAQAIGNMDVALNIAAQFANKVEEYSEIIVTNESCFLESEIEKAKYALNN